MQNQRNQMIAIVRQYELWWKDFLYLVECVERVGARPWIWADCFWLYLDERIDKASKMQKTTENVKKNSQISS